MSNTGFIPAADAGFNEWQNTWYNGTAQRLEQWNISEDTFGALEEPRDRWSEKYSITLDPATRTAPATLAKNEARRTYQTAIRAFVRSYQTYNPLISDDERLAVGLPVHKTTHTPAPVQTKAPEYRVDSSVIRRLGIHFWAEGSATKAKPAGTHGCEVKWAPLAQPPTSVDDLVHSSFDTNSPLTLEFDESQRGKTIYLCLRWENTRGDKGPWSEIGNAIVP
jgi:hypothetical protein